MSCEVVTPHCLFVLESLCILNLEDLSVLINHSALPFQWKGFILKQLCRETSD